MNAVATHFEAFGRLWPRHQQDIERDKWIAEQLPIRVAALAAQDRELVLAFTDVLPSPALLDAYRNGDDAELGRVMRAAVRKALVDHAESALEDDAYTRFPETTP